MRFIDYHPFVVRCVYPSLFKVQWKKKKYTPLDTFVLKPRLFHFRFASTLALRHQFIRVSGLHWAAWPDPTRARTGVHLSPLATLAPVEDTTFKPLYFCMFFQCLRVAIRVMTPFSCDRQTGSRAAALRQSGDEEWSDYRSSFWLLSHKLSSMASKHLSLRGDILSGCVFHILSLQ